MHTLPDRPAAVLDTKPLTPEVAAFVGELLRRNGDPLRSHTLQAVYTWLT